MSGEEVFATHRIFQYSYLMKDMGLMKDSGIKGTEASKSSLKDMAIYVVGSSVFKRNLSLYGIVVLALCPLLIFFFHYWNVGNALTLLSFTTRKLLPAMVLVSFVAAGHLAFSAYLTAREFIGRREEFKSFDAFCEARCKEMGRPSGFVSFPLRFWPEFFGMVIFTISVITILNYFFE